MAAIQARGLRKSFGATRALDGVDLRVDEGRILGIVGRNGAGKSTALAALCGLIKCDGELSVLGRDPWRQRDALMHEVAFIADVAVLPPWLRVRQALDFLAGVHPRFDRNKAEAFLAKSDVDPAARVRNLSKGTVIQLHLALVLAIDARLLVLDEPTLGLDLPARQRFYRMLLDDYFDRDRTIVVVTHEVADLEGILTDVVVLDRGRVVFEASTDEVAERYAEVTVHPDRLDEARAWGPMHERQLFDRGVFLFDLVDTGERTRLSALGEVRTPKIADLFQAVIP